MATKDTRPAAMADSGPRSGPPLEPASSAHPPATSRATAGRAQALPDLIALTRAFLIDELAVEGDWTEYHD
jgi:hypothetical protein